MSLPKSLPGGFEQTGVSPSSGAGGCGFAAGKAEYGRGDACIVLTVTDIGIMGALAALGSAFGAHAEQEEGTGYSKMGQDDGRMTLEHYDREKKTGTFAIILGNRLLVQADGSGVTMEELKAAVRAVDPAETEALSKSPEAQ